MATTKSFSLYMGKAELTSVDQFLTEKAQELLKSKSGDCTPSASFGDGATLFTFPGESYPPDWAKMLTSAFGAPANLFTQSPCAVLAFKKAGRFFATTFSFAHVYVDDRTTEADFGLRVAINALTDGKLKSVERANIGAAIRDFAQAAGPRDLHSFGFDDALDLIRKVSGRVLNEEFADTVTGSRALRFSKKMELSDLPDAAEVAARLFDGTAYKKTAFKIIDFLSPVLDVNLTDKLDEKLVEHIVDGGDEFEIGIPEIIHDDAGTFRFEKIGDATFHADLSLELYRDSLGPKLAALSPELLKHHRVAAYTISNGALVDDWALRDALVGSLVCDGDRYALNEGLWYRLGSKFKKSADDKFSQLKIPLDKKLAVFKKILEEKKKGRKVKVGYQSEESYNEDVAAASGYLLMDQKLIQIEDVPGPGVEACDLLDIIGRRFIHVKKSSRQSSVLSHLFKQGGNAARLFKQYEPFKAALVAKVAKIHGANNGKKLQASLNDQWTVEFRIADSPRQDGEFNIPFFSKLSLKDEARSLQAMDFKVGVGFIKLADAK